MKDFVKEMDLRLSSHSVALREAVNNGQPTVLALRESRSRATDDIPTIATKIPCLILKVTRLWL